MSKLNPPFGIIVPAEDWPILPLQLGLYILEVVRIDNVVIARRDMGCHFRLNPGDSFLGPWIVRERTRDLMMKWNLADPGEYRLNFLPMRVSLLFLAIPSFQGVEIRLRIIPRVVLILES